MLGPAQHRDKYPLASGSPMVRVPALAPGLRRHIETPPFSFAGPQMADAVGITPSAQVELQRWLRRFYMVFRELDLRMCWPTRSSIDLAPDPNYSGTEALLARFPTGLPAQYFALTEEARARGYFLQLSSAQDLLRLCGDGSGILRGCAALIIDTALYLIGPATVLIGPQQPVGNFAIIGWHVIAPVAVSGAFLVPTLRGIQ
jgi:hypothetical protein